MSARNNSEHGTPGRGRALGRGIEVAKPPKPGFDFSPHTIGRMKSTILCAFCGEPFEPPSRWTRFCSDRCRGRHRSRGEARPPRQARARKPRRCTRCGSATWSPSSPYCEQHSLEAAALRANRTRKTKLSKAQVARERERQRRRVRPRPSKAERGYDAKFRKERERVARVVAAGNALCARCGRPILPWQEWDLGHVDSNRALLAGPEHRLKKDCPSGGNRATNRKGRSTYTGSWNPRVRKRRECVVLARGAMNSSLIRFLDTGEQVVTIRNAVRWEPPAT